MFSNCTTTNEVKILYRELCFEFHPDVSGYDSTAKMQEINDLYLSTLKQMDGQTVRGTDGKDHTYKYQRAREVGAMDIIDKLLQLQLSDQVEIELLGYWVWVSGIEYKSDDQAKLQTLKHPDKKIKSGQPASLLSWHSKRKRYYWKPEGMQSFYNATATFGDLKDTFGAHKFSNGRRTNQQQPALIGTD